MSNAVLSSYTGAFQDSAVAFAVLDGASREILFANRAFLEVFKLLQAAVGQDAFRGFTALADAVEEACGSGTMVACLCLPANARFELSRLPQVSDQLLLQCVASTIASAAIGTTSASAAAQAVANGMDGYQRVLELVADQVWLCASDGEVFWSNRAARRFANGNAGLAGGDGGLLTAGIHPDDRDAANNALVEALRSGGMEQPHRYRLRDHTGLHHWFQFTLAPVRGVLDEPECWVGTSVDIQAFHEAENAAVARIEQLRRRAEAHESRMLESQRVLGEQHKMALVSHLAGGVAHDLNNLLHVMGINIELMQAAASREALEPHLRILQGCISKAGRLSTQLSGFGGRLPQNAVALDPQSLVDEVHELLSKALGAGIAFKVEMEKGLRPVFADKAYLENALINLAINAREAMEGEGNVTLRVGSRSRLDTAGTALEYVMFEIEDSGVGIAPELQEHVFDPFYSTKRSDKGSGLGLTMVRTFVENSRGHVSLESVAGRGTRVAIYLPYSTVPVEAAIVPGAAITAGVGKVLLVEDDDSVRDAMNSMLTQLGYETIPSFSSDHAVTLLRSGVRPDLIISDIRMPGRLTVQDLIAGVEASGSIPIIFVTGYSADVVIKEGLLNGTYQVVFKPFSAAEMAARIQVALGQSANAAGSITVTSAAAG